MQQWTWRDFTPSTAFDAGLWPNLNRRFRQLEQFLSQLLGFTLGLRTSPDGATTPLVTQSHGLTLANTAPTSITGLTGGEPGQTVILLATDANTTLVTSSTLRLTGAVNWVTKVGETRQVWTPDAVTWYEVPRVLSVGDLYNLALETGDILGDEAGNDFLVE